MPFETTPEDAGAIDVEVMFVPVSLLSVGQSMGQTMGQYMIWTFDEASQHVPEQVKFPVVCCKLVAKFYESLASVPLIQALDRDSIGKLVRRYNVL